MYNEFPSIVAASSEELLKANFKCSTAIPLLYSGSEDSSSNCTITLQTAK